MVEIPQAIYTIIITSVVAGLLSLSTLYIAKKSGIGHVQLAVNVETDRLVAAQKGRIEILEKQVEELMERVENLEAQTAKDKREIQRLRKVIADKAIEEVP